jgi:hypothetical protein
MSLIDEKALQRIREDVETLRRIRESVLLAYFELKFDEIIGAGEEGALFDCAKVATSMALLSSGGAAKEAYEYLQESSEEGLIFGKETD